MNAQAPGWFGKLSALGDFASRRLSPEWVQRCDQWLSRCVEHSRQQLGDAWLHAYLNAPVWRFACGPGVFDEQWWFGVMMASCDNVGRYFPLTVASPRSRAPADGPGLAQLDAWWAHVAQAALETLGDGASVERFEALLAEAPAWPQNEPAVLQTVPGPCEHWRADIADGTSAAQLAQALAAEAWAAQVAGHSLWWPLHAGRTRCLVLPGLPSGPVFADMLLGGG